MPKRSSIILGCVLASHFCSFGSKADIYQEALTKRLNFIFKDEQLDSTHLGVEVFSLSRQESLYRLNADKSLSPASAIKLLTGLVALKKLGADFTYKTGVYATGTLSGGVLKGDLYLKGGGDPSLVTERLHLLADEVARSEIKQITGNIFVDDWTFDQVSIDPNRIVTNSDRPYNAPVGGLSFNYNTTTLYFRPAEAAGQRARVFVEPDTGYIEIKNQAQTTSKTSSYSLVASREKGKDRDNVMVKGGIPLGLLEQKTYFSITQPGVYAGSALKWMLQNRGITVRGKDIKHEKTPSSARRMAELESLPLRDIVILMNKFSNNFIAETLVKTLGREIKGVPGTTEGGLEVIREEATKLGVNTAGFKIVSGSGLTRDNRTSANQFIQLINAAYLDFDVLPELLSSLPIAGRDGTLKRRLKGTSAFGRLRAKTGSIDGVSSLVGIVQSRGGELLGFAVLMNDKSKNPGNLRPWQNYFGQALADYNRKTPLAEKPQLLPQAEESRLED